MKPIDIIKSSAEISKNNILHFLNKQSVTVSSEVSSVLNKVLTNGYAIIPEFLPPKICRQIISEMEQYHKTSNDQLWKDDLGADHRLFGIELASDLIRENFYNHPFIVSVREAYYQLNDKYIEGCTMANRITAIEGNKGSGGGWHRDSVNRRQFKSILYLNDVNEENGCFQYVANTHFKSSVLEGMFRHNFTHKKNRLSQKQVDLILKNKKYTLKSFTGPTGTLLLVDTSGIHRGKPIEEGVRFALTNYYWISRKRGGKGMPEHVNSLLIRSR